MQAAAARRRSTSTKRKRSGGDEWLLLVFGDALVTALWVMISSLFGEAAETLSELSGLGEFALAVAVTVSCIAALGPLCAMFGGAQFNPIHPAAFAVAGKGTLKLTVVRIAAQLLGALAGSYAAFAATPAWLQAEHFHKLPPGLKHGVALEHGIAAELALGFIINLVVLHATDASNKFLAQWLPLVATVALIVAGAPFSGPSMNPAVAFSWHWHYVLGRRDLTELVAVFYVAPFVGALIGGAVYRLWRGAGSSGSHRLPATLKAH